MLSKYAFFEAEKAVAFDPGMIQALQGATLRHFRAAGHSADISFVDGGTLGICAHLSIDDDRRFLKTHLHNETCRQALKKEIELLTAIYGDRLRVETFDLEVLGQVQVVLVMNELQQLASPLDPPGILALIDEYSVRMRDKVEVEKLSVEHKFSDLLDEGGKALAHLSQRDFVSPATRDEIGRRLSHLGDMLDRLVPSVCHGDLGPRNVMTDGRGPIAIDWEDAFWGVVGYDYLYWLSFMANRKYYPNAFGRTPYGPDIELAILALIIVLKSALSVRSGEYLNHKTTIEERLGEVIGLAS